MEKAGLYQNTHPKFDGPIGVRRGKQARYSFVTVDAQGKPVRKWHPEVEGLPGNGSLADSLRGIVK